jgi:hypothetical protein
VTAKTAESKTEVLPVRANGFTQVVYPGLGSIAMYGLLALILVILTAFGFSWQGLATDVLTLFAKGPMAMPHVETQGVLTVTLSIISVIVATVVLSVVVVNVFSRIIGKAKSYKVAPIEELLDRGPAAIFLTVMTEELISRGFFLGLILPLFGSSHLAFVALFLLGNLLFAALHFMNFADKTEWSIWRVLPQFIGGVTFTYIFMRWGLTTAVVTHFYYDVVVLSYIKEQKPDIKNILVLAYYVVLAIITVLLMSGNGLQVSDISGWITGRALTPIDGYTVASYAIVLIFIDSISAILGEALLLDYTVSTPSPKGFKARLTFPFNAIYSAFIQVGSLFVLNLLLGFVMQETLTRAVFITMLLSLLSFSTSGSSLARATMINLPGTFLAVIAISVLDFRSAFILMLLFYLATLIPDKIRAYKAKVS